MARDPLGARRSPSDADGRCIRASSCTTVSSSRCEPRLGRGTRAVVALIEAMSQTLSEVMRILTRRAIFSDAKAAFSISVENDDGD